MSQISFLLALLYAAFIPNATALFSHKSKLGKYFVPQTNFWFIVKILLIMELRYCVMELESFSNTWMQKWANWDWFRTNLTMKDFWKSGIWHWKTILENWEQRYQLIQSTFGKISWKLAHFDIVNMQIMESDVFVTLKTATICLKRSLLICWIHQLWIFLIFFSWFLSILLFSCDNKMVT